LQSVISKRCQRIYEEELKYVEAELYKHLKLNEVPPELHLTRWLRCVLSREYSVEPTLILWDYIFAGVVESQQDNRHRSSAVCEYDEFDLRAP
jgi:TBC1 domain family protein 5